MVPLPRLLPAMVLACVLPAVAPAEIHRVGPTRDHTTIQSVATLLQPGDVVEVDGDATYAGPVRLTRHGTADERITLRGIRVNGNRPRIHGGADVVRLEGNHYNFEGFEVTGSADPLTTRAVFCVAHDLILRDLVVHDSPRHGILGADNFSGDVLMEYVEVHHTGSGDRYHQVYMATDNAMYPAGTFRMRFCYLHDANGGNNVKTRAARNEIHYNWIEGAFFHELELIGADPDGQSEDLPVREDSEVVGNVLIKNPSSGGSIARIGGDGTGDSFGRFRFLNNTMIMPAGTAGLSCLRIFDHAESLEFFNNVVYRGDSTAFRVVRTVEAQGDTIHSGGNNWISIDGFDVPAAWTGSTRGTAPGFANAAARDYSPLETGAIRNAGLLPTAPAPEAPFPSPLAAPAWHPPLRNLLVPGTATPRPTDAPIDIGAFEYGQTINSTAHFWMLY